MVSEFARVQQANGDGSICGFPNSKKFAEEIRKGNVGIVWNYWVAWYNMHKTYAGLRDAWLYGKNEKAKKIFLKFCDWGVDVISNLDDRQMERMLDNEFGGMNEVYADAWQMTGNPKYLDTAKRFSHKQISTVWQGALIIWITSMPIRKCLKPWDISVWLNLIRKPLRITMIL